MKIRDLIIHIEVHYFFDVILWFRKLLYSQYVKIILYFTQIPINSFQLLDTFLGIVVSRTHLLQSFGNTAIPSMLYIQIDNTGQFQHRLL